MMRRLDGEPEIFCLHAALRSIYSEENAISIWKPEQDTPLFAAILASTIRLEIRTA